MAKHSLLTASIALLLATAPLLTMAQICQPVLDVFSACRADYCPTSGDPAACAAVFQTGVKEAASGVPAVLCPDLGAYLRALPCAQLAGLEHEAQTDNDVRVEFDVVTAIAFLELFYVSSERYPIDLEELNASGLMSTPIETDPWGHPYVYEVSASGGRYVLYSMGPDGLAGTPDDIAPSLEEE